MPRKTDVKLTIATGRNRSSKKWKTVELLWSELVNRLKKTHRTAESFEEYQSETKGRRDEIKDVGGFVGVAVTGGERKKGAVLTRSFITLDMDEGRKGDWSLFKLQYDCAAVVYTTHSHAPDKPRYRFVIPLDREVNGDEYEAIGRKLAGDIDIERFDNTAFQVERLMYWPSTSKD